MGLVYGRKLFWVKIRHRDWHMRESKFGPGIGKWDEVNLGKNVT